jgi:hypothetical protein
VEHDNISKEKNDAHRRRQRQHWQGAGARLSPKTTPPTPPPTRTGGFAIVAANPGPREV